MSKLLVSKPKQLDALFSPVRLEIVEALELFGPCSISEVSADLDRTPHSLYHHFHRLVDVGLIKEVDTRRSGARDEAVYDVCGRPVIVNDDLSTPKARTQRVKAARVLLRQAERDYAAAVEGAGKAEQLSPEVRRYRVRLRQGSIQKIRGHLDTIVELILAERLRASDQVPDSRWISWISLLAPQAPKDID